MYTEILKCIPDEYIAQHSFSIPAVVKLFQELSKDYVKLQRECYRLHHRVW